MELPLLTNPKSSISSWVWLSCGLRQLPLPLPPPLEACGLEAKRSSLSSFFALEVLLAEGTMELCCRQLKLPRRGAFPFPRPLVSSVMALSIVGCGDVDGDLYPCNGAAPPSVAYRQHNATSMPLYCSTPPQRTRQKRSGLHLVTELYCVLDEMLTRFLPNLS